MMFEMGGHCRHRLQYAALEFTVTEMCLHESAHSLPFRGVDPAMDAAVGDDFQIAVRQQQIDQHTVIVFGVPHPQQREQFERPRARRLPAPQRAGAERAFDYEADLAEMAPLAGTDRRLDGGQHRRRKVAAHPGGRGHEMAYPASHIYHLPEAPPPPKPPPP